MKISKTHHQLKQILGRAESIVNLPNLLGPNYKTILNFWIFLDTLTQEQWSEINLKYQSLPGETWNNAWSISRLTANRINTYDRVIYNAVGTSTIINNGQIWNCARNISRLATRELMCSHVLLEEGKSLVAVPLFEFTSKPESTISVSELIRQLKNLDLSNSSYTSVAIHPSLMNPAYFTTNSSGIDP